MDFRNESFLFTQGLAEFGGQEASARLSAAIALIGAVCALYLPETLNKVSVLQKYRRCGALVMSDQAGD